MFDIQTKLINSFDVRVFGNKYNIDAEINNEFNFYMNVDIGIDQKKYLKLSSLNGLKLSDIINLKLHDVIYEGVITNG